MKTTYNVDEFRKIQKLAEDNYVDKAFSLFQRYLLKYPDDVCAKSYYIDLLIKIGRFDDAEVLLDDIQSSDINIKNIASENLKLMRIKLLCCTGRYEESYSLLLRDADIFYQRGWLIQGLYLFLKKQLGLLETRDYKQNKYLLSQIVKYDEKRFMNYMEEYTYDVNLNKPVYFIKNFPVKKIVNEIKDKSSDNYRIYSMVNYVQIFRLMNNGVVNGKSVDYIKVVSLLDSNNIITMYPYENIEALPSMDLSSILVEDEPKVKRISQIDKFNSRYGIK